MSYVPPLTATELIFYIGLTSQANTKIFQANPTLASGDVKVSKDGGALAHLNTLPTVTPASGKLVKVTVSAAEMTADNTNIVFSDAAGDEWCDVIINAQAVAKQLDSLATPAEVNAQVLDVLNVDTFAEPSGVPAFPMTLREMQGRTVAALIHGLSVNSATGKLQFKNAAGTVIWEKDLTNAAGVYTESAGNAP